ncbi:hypothetical protein AX17_001289 [Amanita inopinata Kibby_2008]|nr:hypothetical protein AX17_001289 [Amanita inopinata Kibby_2008]
MTRTGSHLPPAVIVMLIHGVEQNLFMTDTTTHQMTVTVGLDGMSIAQLLLPETGKAGGRGTTKHTIQTPAVIGLGATRKASHHPAIPILPGMRMRLLRMRREMGYMNLGDRKMTGTGPMKSTVMWGTKTNTSSEELRAGAVSSDKNVADRTFMVILVGTLGVEARTGMRTPDGASLRRIENAILITQRTVPGSRDLHGNAPTANSRAKGKMAIGIATNN